MIWFFCVWLFFLKVRAFLMQPMEGVVLQTYGQGNGPTARLDLMEALREANDRGVIMINITQCARGTVTPAYEVGQVWRLLYTLHWASRLRIHHSLTSYFSGSDQTYPADYNFLLSLFIRNFFLESFLRLYIEVQIACVKVVIMVFTMISGVEVCLSIIGVFCYTSDSLRFALS